MGQKLKVVPGPFGAVVFLDRYELVVHLNGSFVKSYRVGVGRDGTTPIGMFTVKNKMVNPTYYGPEGIIPSDDPKNPLGERWIDIGDSYGIHGTIEPDSIGKNESRGCIRMLNSEVEEVYDFLVIGSEVKIQK
jgi:lipoprotein-anchoring transpeptidase ErfK/SrfK